MALRAVFLVAVLPLLMQFQAISGEPDGSVRLRGGAHSPLEGRVEVYLDGEWGTIRDGGWGAEEATVVCRQLGFATANFATPGGKFDPAPTSVPVHLDRVECVGVEGGLGECESVRVNRQHSRQHNRDAGVVCAVEGSLRLLDGAATSEGRLEMLWEGAWQALCSEGWGLPEVGVACRQLGFHEAEGLEDYEEDSSLLLTSEGFNCTGEEYTLQSCGGFPLLPGNCTSGRGLAIHCTGAPATPHRPRLDGTSCSTLTVSWPRPLTRGSRITSYTLRYKQAHEAAIAWQYEHLSMTSSPDSEPSSLDFDPSSSDSDLIAWTVRALEPSVLYEVQVRAEGEDGNSSFSESLLAATAPAEILPPEQLTVVSVDSETAALNWTAPPSCGVTVTGYELSYQQLDSPANSCSETVPQSPALTDAAVVTFTLRGLQPFSRYNATVRVLGYSGEGSRTLLASGFTEVVELATAEAAPTGPPQSVSAFLTHISSAAQFQWGPVLEGQKNGLLLGYTISCNYSLTANSTLVHTVAESVGNSSLQYQLEPLLPGMQYSCSVSAMTAGGRGPGSPPVEFTTPNDLNARPNPPDNVGFEIISPTTTSTTTNAHSNTNYEATPIIRAHWDVIKCGSSFSCSEVLGYVATCRSDSGSSELRNTVWQYEVQDKMVAMTTLPAQPYVRYSCSMAALNSYGVGIHGSIILVETPESAPTQSPMQLYTSNIGSADLLLHWTYNEDPPTGRILGFNIETYYPDSHFPEENGEFIHEELYSVEELNAGTEYTFHLMFLRPGNRYNVLVSAATIAGEGPQARITVSTLRTVPTVAPTNFQSEIATSEEPYRYTFTWDLSHPGDPTHSGFVIHCHPDAPPTNTTGGVAVSHAVFSGVEGRDLSTTAAMPGGCSSTVLIYVCSIAAFNEQGVGPSSNSVSVYLPCVAESITEAPPFAGTFLTHPYYSLAFLSALILLIIIVLIAIVALCLCNRYLLDWGRSSDKSYEPVEMTMCDESYISMAPSNARPKPSWTTHPCNPRRLVGAAMGVASSNEEPEDHYNPYDEIPGDSRQENLYDEIHPKTRVISTSTQENLSGSTDLRLPRPRANIPSVHLTAQVDGATQGGLVQHHTEELIEESRSSISGSARSIPELLASEEDTATTSTTLGSTVAAEKPSTEYVQVVTPGTPVIRGLVVPATYTGPNAGSLASAQLLGAYDHLEKAATSTDYYNIPSVMVIAEINKDDNPSGAGEAQEVATKSDEQSEKVVSRPRANSSAGASQKASADFKHLSDCTDMSTSVIPTTEGITSSE